MPRKNRNDNILELLYSNSSRYFSPFYLEEALQIRAEIAKRGITARLIFGILIVNASVVTLTIAQGRATNAQSMPIGSLVGHQGLRGWELCTICPFFATFSTFTKIPQVPSFQAHSPVKTVSRQNPKNARKSQNTPSTNPYQNDAISLKFP
jgi:hypothetical protein